MTKPKAKEPLHVAVGVIKNQQGEILISRRADAVHQGGLWEFPGGKVEQGEAIYNCLCRELKEELDIQVLRATPLIKILHSYADLDVLLDVWIVEQFSGLPASCEGQPLKWLPARELSTHAFPAANLPIISAAVLPHRYAILSTEGQSVALLTQLQKLLQQGLKLVQLRQKNLRSAELKDFLLPALALCAQYDAELLVNSAMLEKFSGAAYGLHLTSTDLLALQQRPQYYPYVAASCHNLTELEHAQAIGVDFAVLSPVHETRSHPEARALGWAQFATWLEEINIPVYALGGMLAEHEKVARQCGGQGIAAISLFNDNLLH